MVSTTGDTGSDPSAPSGATPTGQVTPTGQPIKVFKPTKPKMGGIEEVRDQDFTAWTGGKPKADWSGLEDPGAERTNIYQQRPTA
eukprot:scaffold6586_cov70-Cylindrotheca_fusiformis.AAC.1